LPTVKPEQHDIHVSACSLSRARARATARRRRRRRKVEGLFKLTQWTERRVPSSERDRATLV